MDEFDKIQELSDDIIKRKEPSFDKKEATDEADEDTYQFLKNEDNPLLDMELEKESHFPKKYFVLGIVLVLVLGGIGIVFFVGGRDGQSDEIITISPSPDPVRVKPEQPGGAVIPDQDKMLYNRAAVENETPKIEKLFPEPEKPVLPEIIIQNTPEQTFVPAEEVVGFNPLSEKTEPVIIDKPVAAEKPVAAAAKPQKEIIPLPTKAEVVAAPTPKKVESHFRVQLLSTTKRASAEKAWPTILNKNKALLSNMSHEITVANIAGKGTFYRLQVGQFSNKDQAASLCKKLKARKQECVPVEVGK